ncbi:ead/Ea22-like family protein [Enterobacter kobei]|uniref:ead/Ea22-like family protein n=1 Tax=Enterobacter kobei TaxID=208224 RepID=UPI0034A02716
MKDEDIAMNSRPMSNIDKQKLREAAEKATPGEWKRMMRNSDELMTTFHGIAIGNVFVELTTGKRDIFDAEFIAASNPATMLALLDELEAKDKRIAELEAREVVLPSVQDVHPLGPQSAKIFCEFHRSIVNRCADEIRKVGVKVSIKGA